VAIRYLAKTLLPSPHEIITTTLIECRIKERPLTPDDHAPSAPSFTEVVNAHWTAVYRFLHTMTRHTHDTEDLTQETFLRALNRFASFEPGSRLRAWLLRIAANAYFDLRRKQKRRPAQPLKHEPLSLARPPGHALETAEKAELVRAALAELSDLTRLVFHLRVQEELSFREIAELAGTTEQSARWHMHQARTRLLKRFQDD
jgi:RNA polymerase sigma-70 factor, ECF subfamily